MLSLFCVGGSYYKLSLLIQNIKDVQNQLLLPSNLDSMNFLDYQKIDDCYFAWRFSFNLYFSVMFPLFSLGIQEFVEARRTAGLNNAPLCMWSSSPPLELKGVPSETLSANAGFVTFGNIRWMSTDCFFLFYSCYNFLMFSTHCSDISPTRGREKIGSYSLEFINFPCIC